MNSFKLPVVSLLFAFTTVGCAASGDHFDITVINLGKDAVSDVVVVGASYRRQNKRLSVGVGGTRGYYPDEGVSMPKYLMAKWRTPDGHFHRHEIVLSIPGRGTAMTRYGVPEGVQWWHIVVAYLDNVVSSAWVLFDERYKKDPHFFGRQVVYGGDVELLLRAHLLTPDLIETVPRYLPGSATGPGMSK